LGGVFLILGMIGVRDHLAYNRALWSAVSYLHEQGVKDIDIDGGYVVNGWLQYAHPQNAKRDNHGDVQVNWVNAKDLQGPYRISNHPMNQCQAMKVIQYHRWLGRSGSIYVLRK
jgi:hypothetical protein